MEVLKLAKYIDLTNKKIGKLTILERDYNTGGKTGTYWKCQCECGTIASYRRDVLLKGNKTSCGCDLAEKNSKAHLKDETGKRYGYLTVLYRAGTKNGCATWLCQCDCGNQVIVYGSTLRNGETTSCGCRKHESRNGINEIGNRYGKLVVIEKGLKPENNTHIFWKCKCDCGNEIEVNGQNLRNGTTKSCGCLRMSSGETAIEILLKNNGIKYKSQFTFEDCVSEQNNLLRFDFAIFDTKGNLIELIEYNGKQHYEPIEYFGGKKGFETLQKHDQIKSKYCKDNNIKLIVIPYTINTNDLTLQDLEVNINE